MFLSAFKTVLVVAPEICSRVLVLVKHFKATMQSTAQPFTSLTASFKDTPASTGLFAFLKASLNRLDQILIEERLATGCRCPIQ